MKRRLNPFVVIYLLIVFLPLAIIATALTAIITIIMSTLFGDHKWGYYPAMVWSRVICALGLVRVGIEVKCISVDACVGEAREVSVAHVVCIYVIVSDGSS
jgi:hypothetical protein